MTKYLLNTFDYELFLGKRSGVPQECMIDCTNQLVKVLDAYKAKAIFFVDTAYLYMLRKNISHYDACRIDYENIKMQLQDLIRRGHYVFPHIHAHWLDAKYFPETNQWQLNNIERYRFHNISNEDRELLFATSIEILREIIFPINPDYKINAYRAGGWSLQPFKDYKPFFEKYGIQYDFTVMPGLFQFSNAQYFDFTKTPQKLIYKFEDDVIEEARDGYFTEITCSVLEIPDHVIKLHRVHQMYLHRILKDHTFARGDGQRPVNDTTVKPKANYKNGTAKNTEVAAIELLSVAKLGTYLKYFKDHGYLQFVSHPKMLSKHNLTTYKKFLDSIFSEHEVETDYLKIVEKLNPQAIRKINNPKSVSNVEVSVIIPCYNVEDYIGECLQAVFAQDLLPSEVICIDDGSTDRTLEILNTYKTLHPDKIHILINDGKRGATYSRNRGLVMAQSEYLNFFDADDLMLPFKLKHQVEILNNLQDKPDILVSATVKEYINGSKINFIYYEQDPWSALMNAVLGVTSPNLFKRSKVLEIQGWAEDMQSSQEYELMFRMLKANATVYFDTTIACRNRERASGSISKTNPDAKWKRYIDLRIRIYEHLKNSGKLTPSQTQTFVNVLLSALRIYYFYDPAGAIKLHDEYIRPVGTPGITNALSAKYLNVYHIFGFEMAQKMWDWISRPSKQMH